MDFPTWYIEEWPKHQFDSGKLHADLKMLKWAITGMFSLQVATLGVLAGVLVR